MIKTGRFGTVKYTTDPLGITPAPASIASLNSWKLSTKRDKEDVSCFGDINKVYIFGLKDLSGTVGGFWNSSDVVLFQAANADVPGWLELSPNSTEPTFKWSGAAVLDADIDCSLNAPKVSGSWAASGAWTMAPAA